MTSAATQLSPTMSNPRHACWKEYRERALSAGQAFIEAVEAAVPVIKAGRFESEANGRVPDKTVEAMIEAGVFRTFTPLQYGGLEIDPASFFAGIMKVGAADSSAAWIAGQLNCHAFEIALMSKRMQDEFWANGPDTRASSSYAPFGKPEKAEGAYLLNGT